MYFALGSKKTDFWPVGRDLVDFAVRRSRHVEIIVLVERQRLRREFLGFEGGGHLSGGIDPHHFGIGAAGGVEVSFRVQPQRPEIGEVGVGERREFRRQDDLAVAAQRHAMSGAPVEILEIRLAPETRVFGGSRRRPGGQDH